VAQSARALVSGKQMDVEPWMTRLLPRKSEWMVGYRGRGWNTKSRLLNSAWLVARRGRNDANVYAPAAGR
jgi:hypothetical protein